MPRLPRIAILSSFPADHTSFSGGVETATAALLEGLRDYHAEFEFHLVATSRSLPTDVHEQREGVWYHFLGGLHRPWLRPRLPLGMLKARGELSRIRPDLVHCQDNADLVLAAVLDGHRPILTIHGLSSCEVHLRTGWEYWSTRASMILGRLARRYVDVYLYNSAYVAGIVGGRQRTFTIPNAVSSTFLRWQPSPTPSKGPYLMFAGGAAARVPDARDIHLR
jgi:glycosyltransferase involved in cell wall biosynthesis